MPYKHSKGFSIVEAVVILLVLALAGFGGWFVWHKHKNIASVQPNTRTANKDTSVPDGWAQYTSKDGGVSFAYPSSWKVSDPKMVDSVSGVTGWSVAIAPVDPQKGDPSFYLSTYPANAGVRDVDAGVNDSRLENVTTADRMNLTIVGMTDTSVASSPTTAYLSSCWPRHCTPKLANGRSLAVDAGAIDESCESHVVCATPLNLSSHNYRVFVDIIKTIKSL